MPMLTRQQWNILFFVVLISGGLFIAATRVQPQQPASAADTPAQPPAQREPAPLQDHPAPDFRLTTLEGDELALSDLRGQVVLVNFWATWCPPCRAEMPAIQSAYEQYDEQGFTVLAVNMREQPQQVQQFMQYRANVLPSSFFVDRQGIIRSVYRGPVSHGIITGVVEQLLREEP
jgi:thiol-disulfide isomerase/thioredoxin